VRWSHQCAQEVCAKKVRNCTALLRQWKPVRMGRYRNQAWTSCRSQQRDAQSSDSGIAMQPTVPPAEISVNEVSALNMFRHSGVIERTPRSRMKPFSFLACHSGWGLHQQLRDQISHSPSQHGVGFHIVEMGSG
jgi:hypothetical protein